MKVLVTGGCGFIGSNLADFMLSRGDEVTVLDNLSRSGVKHNLEWLKGRHRKSFRFVRGDVRKDQEKLDGAVEGADAVYHTAAQVAVTTSVSDPRMDFEVNLLGTLNVLEAIRKSGGNPVLVFTSTNKVYGEMNDFPIEEADGRYDYKSLKTGNPESTPLDFHSPYGCSKGGADQYVRDYARIYGMKNVVFRMSCIYGTRQFGCVDQGWVAYFIISSILGRKLTIFGDGKQARDVLYIDDLVKAFDLATKNASKTAGQVYNIGGGPQNVMSLRELISLIEELSGKKLDYSFDKWRPGDQRIYYSDARKAKRDFSWTPSVSKRDGVTLLYEWIRENRKLFTEL